MEATYQCLTSHIDTNSNYYIIIPLTDTSCTTMKPCKLYFSETQVKFVGFNSNDYFNLRAR